MVDDLFDFTARSGALDGNAPAGDAPDADAEGDVVGDVVLRVHVQPGAGRGAAVGRHGDALKVRVAAPPQGGRANDACAAFLADTFGVPPARVTLASGASSRSKRFTLAGVELAAFRRRLEQLVHDGQAGPGPDVRQGIR
jgi:uncharacterized protein (TIGR00251 family)